MKYYLEQKININQKTNEIKTVKQAQEQTNDACN